MLEGNFPAEVFHFAHREAQEFPYSSEPLTSIRGRCRGQHRTTTSELGYVTANLSLVHKFNGPFPKKGIPVVGVEVLAAGRS